MLIFPHKFDLDVIPNLCCNFFIYFGIQSMAFVHLHHRRIWTNIHINSWDQCLKSHIYLMKAGFCVFYYCTVLWCVQIIEYNMARWSYTVIYTLHYFIIIIMQTCLKVFCLECVSKIRSILSNICHALYGAVCNQLTHFSYDDCENMCIWSSYHHQIGSMTYLPLFGV